MPAASNPTQSPFGGRWIVALVFVLAVGGIWFWRNWQPASAVTWMDDPHAAFERARAEGKPVLMRFELPACPGCAALNREVFADPLVGRRVHAAFVPVSVDLRRRRDLGERYGVVVAPTCVILTADGEAVLPAASPTGASRRQWFDRFLAAGLAAFRERAAATRPATASAPTRPQNTEDP